MTNMFKPFDPNKGWHKGSWQKGSRVQHGHWKYLGDDLFTIHLSSKDTVTGQPRVIDSYGDEPGWGKWKLVRKDTA